MAHEYQMTHLLWAINGQKSERSPEGSKLFRFCSETVTLENSSNASPPSCHLGKAAKRTPQKLCSYYELVLYLNHLKTVNKYLVLFL